MSYVVVGEDSWPDRTKRQRAFSGDSIVQPLRSSPEQESVRTGDERNYARVLERLQPFKDRVDTHEKNVEALKRELANLYR